MDTIEIDQASCCETGPDAPALSIRRIWEARGGTPVLLRAIEDGDLEIERDLVDRLSSRSCYMRLMSARKPTEDELIRWTRIDRRREGAVIATIWSGGCERLIGVARYAMNDGETDVVECAIVIDDAWHRQGLGRVLLSSLIDLAERSGMKRLVGTTLSENDAMIGLARSLGFMLSREPGAAFVTDLRLDLESA
ncbi:GNAT family N-acetyltransferase [Burkholderia cepacia]|uniref:GCN5-like N-acetyltransferaser n=1 Tax=Burkholderia cepacia GG4 TaxID=1009846 RepID=A0A9W3JZD8_BURCE|nr:GNAT family N-acetyltransferase [Burkholderia cepacia]AFQ48122.1 GCN5-like N-acetyltransferaser [Burkholderia cepacia GG4]